LARWSFPAMLVLAASLHGLGIGRTFVPAQDGLKFIRIAERFQIDFPYDVVRGTDQHPLYPACLAAFEPVVARMIGHGPRAWRIAAQGISVIASLALIWPLFRFTRSTFDESTAKLACLLYVLAPSLGQIGIETLSDMLALLWIMIAIERGRSALETGRIDDWLISGIAVGLGYWTRPECLVAAVAIATAACVPGVGSIPRRTRVVGLVLFAFGAASLFGLYAIVKREPSEKLAFRKQAIKPGSKYLKLRKVPQWLPKGLDEPRWDFSPKEESDDAKTLKLDESTVRIAELWIEGMGFVLAPFALWGFVRARSQGPGVWIARCYSVVFLTALERHAVKLGYLSHRHVLSLVLLSIPWTAGGLMVIGRRLARIFEWDTARKTLLGGCVVAALLAGGVWARTRPSHVTRWGHYAAGRWIAENTTPSEAVLDTRGWAAFESTRISYDYWHVRQALTDSKLAIVVVGADELSAPSRRGKTLKALLRRSGELVASFPAERGGVSADVLVYRFHRPETWEGLE
jgi:hypothetical protein